MSEKFVVNDPHHLAARWVRPSTVKHLLDGSGFSQKPNALEILLSQFAFDYQNPPHTYPYSQYLAVAEYIRHNYYSHLNEEAGYELLGYLAVMDYYNGSVGRIVKMAAALLGPQKIAKQFLTKITGTLSWAEHSLEFESPHAARYHTRYVPSPAAMMRGAIKASLEISGAKITELYTITVTEENVIHVIKWS